MSKHDPLTMLAPDVTSGSKLELLISLQNVHKSFSIGSQEVLALRGVTMEIYQGERLSIQGASGAGKTTLLQVLGALTEPTRGLVHYRGENIYAFNEKKRAILRGRRLGFVFQSYHLLSELTVLENVVLPSLSSWQGVRQAMLKREKARTLLEQVGMTHRLEHRPVELSGGEQQRTALARALMNDPEVVFADEPTGNLDSKTGDIVLDLLFTMMDERAHTLVMVTHNDDVAARCDRNLVLQDGTIQ